MQTKYIVAVIGFVAFLIVFSFIGLQGISGELTLQAGDCTKCYTHYYIEPFLRDYFECMTTTPCGTAQVITIHNTKVDIIECLCEDIEKNEAIIIDYYNAELTNEPFVRQPSNDAKFICEEGATKIYRL